MSHRIDLVITELDVGGAEKCFTALAIHLREEGFRVRVLVLGPRPHAPKSALAERMEASKVDLHFLQGETIWKLPKVLRRLKECVDADRPDLAQSFLFHANVLASWIYPNARVPLIGGERVAEPRRWRNILSTWAVSRMVRVVCVSEGVANWCKIAEKIPEKKLVVIPNGIDFGSNSGTSKEESPVKGITRGAPYLLFVGRMTPQKGIDQLVSLAPQFLSSLPDHHLVLIGDGPLRVSLERSMIGSSVENRVHWLGWQSDARPWIASCELLLLPARYEGMPNVVLEAMAERKPVACTDVQGVRELLGPHSDSQTSPKGDFQAWMELVVRLARDPALCRRLGEENEKYARANHDLNRHLQVYTRLYRELLTSSSPRSNSLQ